MHTSMHFINAIYDDAMPDDALRKFSWIKIISKSVTKINQLSCIKL